MTKNQSVCNREEVAWNHDVLFAERLRAILRDDGWDIHIDCWKENDVYYFNATAFHFDSEKTIEIENPLFTSKPQAIIAIYCKVYGIS